MLDNFMAIADPKRRQIIALLADRDRTVNEIAEVFDISRPAISKHLKVLRQTGLVSEVKEGRERIQHFNGEALRPVVDWVKTYGAFWDGKLEDLKIMMEDDK